MAISLASKAPAERADYIWSPPLDSGDTISGVATVTRIAGTVTLDSSAVEAGNLTVKLWFSGGAGGETSEFLAQVTTTGGRIWQETVYLPIVSTALPVPGATFLEAFPAFKDVSDATIAFWLANAGARLADSWPVGERDMSVMLLAAHNMAMNGLGAGAIPAGVTSFKSGTFSATVSEKVAGMTGYGASVYGREYEAMTRRLFGGARLVNTANHV
jgi:hypothetical protein